MFTKKELFYQAIAQKNIAEIKKLMLDDEIKALLADFAECDQLLNFAFMENNTIDPPSILLELLDNITVTNYFAQHTLANASAEGDYNFVNTLLERKAAHCQLYVKGHHTALFQACKNGHKNIVQLFLCSRSLNVFDFNDRSFCYIGTNERDLAIEAACISEAKEIVDMISDRFIKNIELDRYIKLLSNIPITMIELLLTKRPLDDYIPLIIALCKKDKADVINFLVETNQVNLNLIAHQPMILNAIATYGSINTFNYLIQRAEIDINQPIEAYSTTTLLHMACKHGRTDMVTTLLKMGARLNVIDTRNNQTPLFLACINGNIDIVELLLTYKCNVNYATPLGDTCLTNLYLCYNDFEAVAILDRLVIAGADIDAPKSGSLLHTASKFNKVMIVERLVGLRAEINHRDLTGHTPLMLAIKAGNVDIVNIILQHPNLVHQITNNEGQTAAMMAENASTAIRDLFAEINPTLSSSSSHRP